MGLTLAPATQRRERILAYGPPGAGKSYAWQRILAATQPEVHFHVIDTDGAWEPAMDSDEFSPHAHRVTHYEPMEWPEYREALQKIRVDVDKDRGDWVVLDLADKAWTAVQEYYQYRKSGDEPSGGNWGEAMLDEFLNDESVDTQGMWQTINGMYLPFQQRLLLGTANVFVCTTAKDFKKDKKGNYFRERKDMVKMAGFVGQKPGGQKNLAHDVNTVLYFSGTEARSWRFTRVKDRNREEKWGEELERKAGSFDKDFLIRIAGWRPVT